MSTLSQLSPKLLWDFFSKICSIPHPSFHEEKLAKYIVSWANRRKLDVKRDQVGNILIRKEATVGMKNRRIVVLQAHLDMVPQKNNNVVHDFIRDPIQTNVDGMWVKTHGTTLGADNGIGVASILAVLSDNSIEHGPLEALLTINEEVGMLGALALRPNWLEANILINTDSEKEGKIYIGCAGGANFSYIIPLFREEIPNNFQIFHLKIKGLKGGHSGTDIHLGLGNANKLLARLLSKLISKLDLRLVDFNGGTVCNAIPHEALATIAIVSDKVDSLRKLTKKYLTFFQNELSEIEKDFTIILELVSHDKTSLISLSRDKLIQLLNTIPNGVIHHSKLKKNVIKTSLNIGVVTMTENQVTITCLIRSLIDIKKEQVIKMLRSIGKLFNVQVYTENDYPSWQPNFTSPIISLTKNTYQGLFKHKPNIQIVHSGLECGLIKKVYPNMDMISIGPTILGLHSPTERVHIESVKRYWTLLLALLKVIPVK